MPRGSKVLGPMRPLNPGSEGFNIVLCARGSFRFLLPQDWHAHGTVAKGSGTALGTPWRGSGRFRKRCCRASTLQLAALLMEPGERRAPGGRHRVRDRSHEVVR